MIQSVWYLEASFLLYVMSQPHKIFDFRRFMFDTLVTDMFLVDFTEFYGTVSGCFKT